MTSTPAAAVVLGLGSTGLAAVRSLRRRGIAVTGISWKPGEKGRWSRLCTTREGPDPAKDPDGFMRLLLSLQHESRAVVVPSCDRGVLFLATHRDRLAERYHVPALPQELWHVLLDKRRQHEMAVRAGIPRPLTICPEPGQDPADAGEMTFPAFVKPACSCRRSAFFRDKGQVVESAAALRSLLLSLPAGAWPVIVEAVIPGDVSCLYSACVYFACGGEVLLGTFVQQKLRQRPVDFGVGTWVRSVFEPSVLDLAVRFGRAVKYEGMAEIEFKKDARTGELKLIELNPRLWEQGGLALAAGVDFPYLLYADLCGRNPDAMLSFRSGIYWWDTYEDLYAMRELRQRGDLTLASWWHGMPGNCVHPTLAWDDPGPFVAESANTASALASSLGKKIARRLTFKENS